MLRGIDVSSYQRGIDLQSVMSRNGLDFAIVKATEGVGHVQDTCDGFVQTCIKTGRLWGFYHVLNSATGTSQAEFFHRNCQNYFHHGVPVLDVEGENGYPNDPRGRVLDFLNAIRKWTGVRPIVYCNAKCLREDPSGWQQVANEGYGLWLANYYTEGITFEQAETHSSTWMSKPYPWEFAAIWQFTSTTVLDGWPKRLDCDLFFGTADGWNAYAGVEHEQAGTSTTNTSTTSHVLEDGEYRVTIERK